MQSVNRKARVVYPWIRRWRGPVGRRGGRTRHRRRRGTTLV